MKHQLGDYRDYVVLRAVSEKYWSRKHIQFNLLRALADALHAVVVYVQRAYLGHNDPNARLRLTSYLTIRTNKKNIGNKNCTILNYQYKITNF